MLYKLQWLKVQHVQDGGDYFQDLQQANTHRLTAHTTLIAAYAHHLLSCCFSCSSQPPKLTLPAIVTDIHYLMYLEPAI